MLHPETPAVYLICLILLLSLLVHTYRQRTPSLLAWTWLSVWFFAIAAVTLALSFLGDIEGTRRHIMPSVELFRLFFWIFLLPLLDLPLGKFKEIDQEVPKESSRRFTPFDLNAE